MISSQDGTVHQGYMSYTHKNRCVVYLVTIDDRCSVFPLHRVYECIDCCHKLELDILAWQCKSAATQWQI